MARGLQDPQEILFIEGERERGKGAHGLYVSRRTHHARFVDLVHFSTLIVAWTGCRW